MSDMILNDSVPVDKKWGELIRYNIFIMKLVEFVVALILNIIPHLLEPVEYLHCLVSGPPLMITFHLIILYVVDQVESEVELYYCIIQLVLTLAGILNVILVAKVGGAIYGLFYVDMIIALILDIYYQYKERGLKF